MLRTTLLLLPLTAVIFALCTLACNKEPSATTFKGTVTDRKTGKPIEGADFTVGFETTTSVQGSPSTSTEYAFFSTDSKGEFSYSRTSDYSSINGGSNLRKEGYVSNFNFSIAKGRENVQNITLLRRDAVLKISVLNQSGQSPLYFWMVNPEVSIEGHGMTAIYFLKDKLVVNLSKGEEYAECYSLPESRNFLYWDFQPFQTVHKSAFKDTVRARSNDTVEYKITY